MLKRRNPGVPAAVLRWIVSLSAPGPTMVIEPGTAISPLVSVIVPVTVKVIVPPDATAARSEPEPLSARGVTTTAKEEVTTENNAVNKTMAFFINPFRDQVRVKGDLESLQFCAWIEPV